MKIATVTALTQAAFGFKAAEAFIHIGYRQIEASFKTSTESLRAP